VTWKTTQNFAMWYNLNDMKITSTDSTPRKSAGTSIPWIGRDPRAFTPPATPESSWNRPADAGLDRLAAYLRTATFESDAGVQRAACMDVARKLEAEGGMLHKTLSDLGSPREDYDRPGLRALLALADEGAIGAVGVSHITRLGRNVNSVRRVMRFLRKRGVQVFTPDGDVMETSSFSERMV
jgi:hypothetical protein